MSEVEINKYSNGKIYKIWNDANNEVYIGSTFQPLCKRMANHRTHATCENKYNTKLYTMMRALGFDLFHIELIETFPCINKEELRKREGELIREFGTLNSRVENRTQQQYRVDKKQQINAIKRKYALENKERLSEYKKDWYEKNKEVVISRVKVNSEVNRDQKLEYYKKRYEEKKEDLSVKTECPCGGCYTVMSRNKHLKTKLHKKYEESKE